MSTCWGFDSTAPPASIDISDGKFFLVMRDASLYPEVYCKTRTEAIMEAERIARERPPCRVYVLAVVNTVESTVEVEWQGSGK